MVTAIVIIVIILIIAGARGVNAAGHRNDARQAGKYYRKVKPRVEKQSRERIARRHREAREQVSAYWNPKIARAVKRRNKAARSRNYKRYTRLHHEAESLERGMRQELDLVKRLLGSSRVDPRTGESKHGIRRN